MKYTTLTSKPGKKKLQDETVVEGNGKLDFGEYELELWDLRYNGVMGRGERGGGGAGGRGRGRAGLWEWVRPSCVPITIIVTLSLLIVVMALLDDSFSRHTDDTAIGNQCRYEIVESIPENLTFPQGSPANPSTHSAWIGLLNSAQHSVDIAAFYWTLLNSDVSPKPFPSASLGEDVFARLKETGLKEGMKMRIAQNQPSHISPQKDSAILADLGAAKVRNLDFQRLMSGGVLHTKMWLVDDTHIYLGSANMDWRSLTQVKEVGIVIYNCSSLALDMKKIFEVYWQLGEKGAVIPSSWPAPLHTTYNLNHQLKLSLNGVPVSTYLSSSPPPFCPEGRSSDVDAILDVINKAEKFVYVAVMDYFPKTLYERKTKFWPLIDNALRRAAIERGVRVRLLASHWSHSRRDLPLFLHSLSALTSNATSVNIQTRLFVVPAYTPEQEQVPFGRVNHNKYMVTDQVAYIGTSNWSADYFINTGGIGLVVNETGTETQGQESAKQEELPGDRVETKSARQQLQALFERDWDSQYAKPLDDFV
ncbi:5'-3' exonuclease PLD3-like isoform X2 [Portunus trituberculatus]|uniref:5'-3' exonuclease PLD3-like isoform X2 n=1 Tax=Portunus trituberculatus TaxID=210409 RepID=UPI001E1CFD44|nr:5'-3' exonuclease PLD3-like isoform X2 [Portunus trituberculatus]